VHAPDGEVLAFTADHVRELTGLSRRQLAYWDRTGFFSPRHVAAEPGGVRRRVYSFRDLLALGALARLRNRHRVPLQELRRVGRWLAERHAEPWSSLRFAVDGRRVLVGGLDGEALVVPRSPGQTVLPPPGADETDPAALARELAAAAARLRERRPGDTGRVVRHRHVLRNAPRLAGTRVPIAAVWRLHLAGHDEAAILREYPRLGPEDVRAALAHERARGRRR
jgi:DNA-binding transcriptional MerR regulator